MKDLECSYNVFGFEVSASGTPHLQGCITFRKCARFATVRKFIRGRLERPKVLDIAKNYCMKDGDYFIKDERTQGERTDLMTITQDIMAGLPIKECAWKYPTVYVKYPTGMKDLHSMAQVPRRFKPSVSWFYGLTGTGKSDYVFGTEPDVWVSGKDSKFFNNYENQIAACFDDFRGSFCPFDQLLKLLDRYPCTVDVKNGWRQFNSRRIYITSCLIPEEAYPGCSERVDQLLRRIDNIVEFRFVGGIYSRRTIKGKYIPYKRPDECLDR